MTTIVVLVNARPESRAVCHQIYTETTDSAHRVITLAEELNTDLVILGLQKRSATMKLFIGSHARDIFVDTPCPVMAVTK